MWWQWHYKRWRRKKTRYSTSGKLQLHDKNGELNAPLKI
ncbi:hypothetical protein O59_000660 [Cellvibrio sp. BR]|nr:hypothetical protein O59_000660 [Cellvibrio sp. BR]